MIKRFLDDGILHENIIISINLVYSEMNGIYSPISQGA